MSFAIKQFVNHFGRTSRVSTVRTLVDRAACNQTVIDEIRALHRIAIGADGVQFCAHCCLNRVSERRFSCYANHTHCHGNAPCPTLAILGIEVA